MYIKTNVSSHTLNQLTRTLVVSKVDKFFCGLNHLGKTYLTPKCPLCPGNFLSSTCSIKVVTQS